MNLHLDHHFSRWLENILLILMYTLSSTCFSPTDSFFSAGMGPKSNIFRYESSRYQKIIWNPVTFSFTKACKCGFIIIYLFILGKMPASAQTVCLSEPSVKVNKLSIAACCHYHKTLLLSVQVEESNKNVHCFFFFPMLLFPSTHRRVCFKRWMAFDGVLMKLFHLTGQHDTDRTANSSLR